MRGDPVGELQGLLLHHLRSQTSTHNVLAYGSIGTDVRWSPHVLQKEPLIGWYVHPIAPESDRWLKRVEEAQSLVPGLAAGVITTRVALEDEEFLVDCHRLRAAVFVAEKRNSGFVIVDEFASISDYIYGEEIKLTRPSASNVLDRELAWALAGKSSAEKGVLLETLCAVLMSQVEGFTVTSVGVSNRSQQMDVFIHNRNGAGALSNSPIVIVEAKNWPGGKVSPTEYGELERKMKSRHGRAKLGFLVTTGKFTAGVGDERRRDSTSDRMIVLVDGAGLPRLWRGRGSITAAIEGITLAGAVGD
jgi:hypothetical protein